MWKMYARSVKIRVVQSWLIGTDSENQGLGNIGWRKSLRGSTSEEFGRGLTCARITMPGTLHHNPSLMSKYRLTPSHLFLKHFDCTEMEKKYTT
jgi:hypothetical protein